jgi:hypothetical protein
MMNCRFDLSPWNVNQSHSPEPAQCGDTKRNRTCHSHQSQGWGGGVESPVDTRTTCHTVKKLDDLHKYGRRGINASFTPRRQMGFWLPDLAASCQYRIWAVPVRGGR